MKDFSLMQSSEPLNYLNKYFPNLIFLDVLLLLLMIGYLLKQITSVWVFHYDAQTTTWFINKWFIIWTDVLMLNTGKNSNFVQSIFFLFVRKFYHFNFL